MRHMMFKQSDFKNVPSFLIDYNEDDYDRYYDVLNYKVVKVDFNAD